MLSDMGILLGLSFGQWQCTSLVSILSVSQLGSMERIAKWHTICHKKRVHNSKPQLNLENHTLDTVMDLTLIPILLPIHFCATERTAFSVLIWSIDTVNDLVEVTSLKGPFSWLDSLESGQMTRKWGRQFLTARTISIFDLFECICRCAVQAASRFRANCHPASFSRTIGLNPTGRRGRIGMHETKPILYRSESCVSAWNLSPEYNSFCPYFPRPTASQRYQRNLSDLYWLWLSSTFGLLDNHTGTNIFLRDFRMSRLCHETKSHRHLISCEIQYYAVDLAYGPTLQYSAAGRWRIHSAFCTALRIEAHDILKLGPSGVILSLGKGFGPSRLPKHRIYWG